MSCEAYCLSGSAEFGWWHVMGYLNGDWKNKEDMNRVEQEAHAADVLKTVSHH